MISALDLFKIGIGPSASHTCGPMSAAERFRRRHAAGWRRITAEVFGSLAWTGRGHATDSAICLGLLGHTPATVDPDQVTRLMAELQDSKLIAFEDESECRFDPNEDLIFDLENLLPLHSNGMRFRAHDAHGAMIAEAVYYSTGGGFIMDETGSAKANLPDEPYPFRTAAELVQICHETGMSIAEIQMANEIHARSCEEIEAGLDHILAAMFECIERGLSGEGELPGRLKVKRRAKHIFGKLHTENISYPHQALEWVAAYAIAVNEENACGGRVVTAPTNGAAGIIPAVLRYFRDFWPGSFQEKARVFLLTAAAVGSLIKRNASISGADVGCQGEVGSASSMAAAGLAAVLGASVEQIENAAEIAMEHHLGMTCDPVGGRVQVPCIERNAFGASKAILAASLAMRGDGVHCVSLDQVIETMRQTGTDMQSKYKETSRGGLAVNVTEC